MPKENLENIDEASAWKQIDSWVRKSGPQFGSKNGAALFLRFLHRLRDAGPGSPAGTQKLPSEITSLPSQILELKTQIEALESQIHDLTETLEDLTAPKAIDTETVI